MGSLNTESQLIVEEIQGDTLTPFLFIKGYKEQRSFYLKAL